MNNSQLLKSLWNIHGKKEKDPISLIHFVTNKCNARCAHCFIDFEDRESQKKKLDLAAINELTKKLPDSLLNVNLTGGEPFLRADLEEIVRLYFKNTSIESVFFSTHGGFTDKILQLTEKMIQEFPQRKLIYSISVDHFAEEHNNYRKVKDLFAKAMQTFARLKKLRPQVFVNVGITVSSFNCDDVLPIYENLLDQGVDAITATLVRDEGVYKTPEAEKMRILEGYQKLTSKIKADRDSGRLSGYPKETLQGRLMNKKNDLMAEVLIDTYLNPRFLSPCQAGALLGVIYPDGMVYPCEVLEKPMGNLHESDMDLRKIWKKKKASDLRQWIKESRCHCSYECAWSYNILAGKKFQSSMIKAALDRQ